MDFEPGSRARALEQVSEQEHRYSTLCDDTAERRERCEEATAALQALLEKVKSFEEWLEKMEEALEQRKKEKRPIGTLQTVLEEHYVRIMCLFVSVCLFVYSVCSSTCCSFISS